MNYLIAFKKRNCVDSHTGKMVDLTKRYYLKLHLQAADMGPIQLLFITVFNKISDKQIKRLEFYTSKLVSFLYRTQREELLSVDAPFYPAGNIFMNVQMTNRIT